jgi:uncharacterized protein
MRLLALADIHDRFATVDAALEQAGPIDVLILAGDITTNGTPDQVEQVIQSWRTRVPRLFAVSGNMDSPAIDEKLDELGVSLNGRCQRIGEVAFFGCSASPISIGTPYELPEAELQRRIELGFSQVNGAAHLVFVPHAPPHGAVDRTSNGIQAGSTAVRDFIHRAQPGLVLCGHIHEARGQARLGSSVIVNCGLARHGHYVVAELAEHWRIEAH